MNRLVIDASFCGAWVLQNENSPEAEQLLAEALNTGGLTLYAPVLWSYEMLNLLRSALKRKRLNQRDANDAVTLLSRVPLELISPGEIQNHRRIFELACTYDLTSYDASYLELADRLGCPLKSGDKKLNNAYDTHIQS